MSDPYRKVQTGDRLEFPAIAWNAALDAGRAFREGQFGAGSNDLTTTRSGVLVSLINNSGSNLDRYGVLGLGDPLWTPYDNEDAFLRTVVFEGVTPAVPDHLGKFAVLLEPADDGRVARAWIAGVVTVLVDVLDDGDTYADVKDGSVAELESAGYGSAQILWREGGTGSQWAVVRLGNATGTTVWTKTTSSVTARSSATYGTGSAKIQSDSGTAFVDDGATITVKNGTDKVIASGSFLMVTWALGHWWATVPGSCANLS